MGSVPFQFCDGSEDGYHTPHAPSHGPGYSEMPCAGHTCTHRTVHTVQEHTRKWMQKKKQQQRNRKHKQACCMYAAYHMTRQNTPKLIGNKSTIHNRPYLMCACIHREISHCDKMKPGCQSNQQVHIMYTWLTHTYCSMYMYVNIHTNLCCLVHR